MNRRQQLSTAAARPAPGATSGAAAATQETLKITGVKTDLHQRPPGRPRYAIHRLGVDNGSVLPRLAGVMPNAIYMETSGAPDAGIRPHKAG